MNANLRVPLTPTGWLLTILRHLKDAKDSGAVDAGTSDGIQHNMEGG